MKIYLEVCNIETRRMEARSITKSTRIHMCVENARVGSDQLQANGSYTSPIMFSHMLTSNGQPTHVKSHRINSLGPTDPLVDQFH